jgi:hypothetical protein
VQSNDEDRLEVEVIDKEAASDDAVCTATFTSDQVQVHRHTVSPTKLA